MNKQQTLDCCGRLDTVRGGRVSAKSMWLLEEYGKFLQAGHFPNLDELCRWVVERHPEAQALDVFQRQDLATLCHNLAVRHKANMEYLEGWRMATDECCARHMGCAMELRTESAFGYHYYTGELFVLSTGVFYFVPDRQYRGIGVEPRKHMIRRRTE